MLLYFCVGQVQLYVVDRAKRKQGHSKHLNYIEVFVPVARVYHKKEPQQENLEETSHYLLHRVLVFDNPHASKLHRDVNGESEGEQPDQLLVSQ